MIDVGDRDITAQIKKTPQISIFVILGTGLGLVFVAAVFIKYVHIRRWVPIFTSPPLPKLLSETNLIEYSRMTTACAMASM